MRRSSSSAKNVAAAFNSVDKRFGGARVLRDISFVMPMGSICGLIGPNGAGKTTMLRILASDLQATDGSVEVLGYPLPRDRKLVRPAVGYMPDSAGLYDELTLREYLGFFAKLGGVDRSHLQTAVETTIELSGNQGIADRRLQGLSRGESQRVLLARAMIHDPELYLLDEPAAGLDPRGRVELRELLLLLQERGKSILISSHILADVEEICTHLVFIDDGRVLFEGSQEDLRSEAMHRCRIRVETIGANELLKQKLVSVGGVAVVQEQAAAVEIDAPADPAFACHLLRDLVAENVQVISFERRAQSLEEIYLRLTDEPEEK